MEVESSLEGQGINEEFQLELADLNDEGKTFKQIAEIIERKLKEEGVSA